MTLSDCCESVPGSRSLALSRWAALVQWVMLLQAKPLVAQSGKRGPREVGWSAVG